MKNKNWWSRFQLSALAVVGLVYSLQSAAVGYTITGFGTPEGGFNIDPRGINNSGQVVGSYTSNSYSYMGNNLRSFLYSNGAITDIGTLGGTDSYAVDISNGGQVAGASFTASGWPYHAFLYSSGVMTDIGTLAGNSVYVYGSNDHGQVVGWGYVGAGGENAFLYSNGVWNDLGMPGVASDINNTGQIVGSFYPVGSGNPHAFLYANGTMADLGTPGGSLSTAVGINDAGVIIGNAYAPGGNQHAFLYNGSWVNLGTLGGLTSRGLAINNNGQVVGWSDISGGGSHPFLYSDGVMTDVNGLLPAGSGWVLNSANDINDLGQIVGVGSFNGQYQAFLMAPTSVVPIPAAFWLFVSGLIGLLGFMRRRNN